MQRLLSALADFDQFGGASIELVAWDLFLEPAQVRPAWEKALSDGLLVLAGFNEDGERVARVARVD